MTSSFKIKGRLRSFLALALALSMLGGYFPQKIFADDSSSGTTMVYIMDNSAYTVNGKLQTMDAKPALIQGRTMLPIKYVAEPLGAEIDWNESSKQVSVLLGSTLIELWLGQSTAKINGSPAAIDPGNPQVKPLIVGGRTMLPLRFVAEALGCEVEWKAATKEITIYKDASAKIPDAGGKSSSGLLGVIDDIGKAVEIKPGNKKIPDLVVNKYKLPDFKQKLPDISVISPKYEKYKLKDDLKKALTSGDTSVTKDTWGKDPAGKTYPVNPSEADVPIVMRLGCGYNVFGNYASVDALKQQVLDVSKLIADQQMVRERYDTYEFPHVISHTIREYSEQMSQKANAGGSFMGFGGQIRTNFSESSTKKTENYFATQSHLVKKYGVYVKGTANLKNYLTPEAKALINDPQVPATALFDIFGHYVLVDTITGGRIDYSITADSTASSSFENFSFAVKAEYNVLFAKANAGAEYEKIKNKQAYIMNRETEFKKYGGGPIYETQVSDPTALANWENSLENQGTLVAFGSAAPRALVPLWDLCSGPNSAARSKYLRDEFEKLNQAEGSKWPSPKYVVAFGAVLGDSEWEARGYCPEGFLVKSGNLNEGTRTKPTGGYSTLTGRTIFLITLSGEEGGAYTDFFMEFPQKKNAYLPREEKVLSHNGNVAKYVRLPADLNDGAPDSLYSASSKDRANHIYLWGTRDKTLPPIREMAVVVGEDPKIAYPGWQVVCWQNTNEPADVNYRTYSPAPVYIVYRR